MAHDDEAEAFPLSREALLAKLEHDVAQVLNPMIPSIVDTIVKAVNARMARTPQDSEAEVTVPGWGRLKLTGGAVIIIATILCGFGAQAYMTSQADYRQQRDHAAIETKYDQLVKEAQTTNYLQSLPPDKRPPLPMPPHLRDLLIRAHGQIPTP